MTWLLAALSFIGVILNIKRHRSCFYVWAVTNLAWTIIDYQAEIYAQAALCFVYFLLALWGILEWRKK